MTNQCRLHVAGRVLRCVVLMFEVYSGGYEAVDLVVNIFETANIPRRDYGHGRRGVWYRDQQHSRSHPTGGKLRFSHWSYIVETVVIRRKTERLHLFIPHLLASSIVLLRTSAASRAPRHGPV